MDKRIVAVICVVVAFVFFFGGILYGAREYIVVVERQQAEYDALKSLYDEYITIPLDIDFAYGWLDWAILQHQYHIDNKVFTERESLEFHQKAIDMYSKIRVLFQEFEKEFGNE